VQEQRRAQRIARYEQILALHRAGALQQEIAERLQITRATVSRYLKATGFPERTPYPRLESKLDPYHAYLSERWAAGETNGQQLWQELQEQGFEGSLRTVMRWAARQHLLSPPLRQVDEDATSRSGKSRMSGQLHHYGRVGWRGGCCAGRRRCRQDTRRCSQLESDTDDIGICGETVCDSFWIGASSYRFPKIRTHLWYPYLG
jgi:hypothetical protein